MQCEGETETALLCQWLSAVGKVPRFIAAYDTIHVSESLISVSQPRRLSSGAVSLVFGPPISLFCLHRM